MLRCNSSCCYALLTCCVVFYCYTQVYYIAILNILEGHHPVVSPSSSLDCAAEEVLQASQPKTLHEERKLSIRLDTGTLRRGTFDSY